MGDPAAEERALAAGTMLDDKYRIEHLLAVGGMGEVYVGTHTKLRKRVAIKVLNPKLSSPPMIERFHREAITASQIGHEGIAQVTDLGTSLQGEPFLVMELLEGEPLSARIRNAAPLSVEVACELGCAILSPLEAAHRAGIVHRDLKPDNVYLVQQSRGEMVKLLDFGISRASGLDGEFRLTTTGLVLGTPFYMSPEQARGDHEITIAADLYAFGVILYEMLIGAVPIQADNYNQLMYRVMTGEYIAPRQHRPDLPEALERLILHAMALDATARPASAAALEQELLAYCRPTFREHTIERLSGPRLPRHSQPPPLRLTPAPGTLETDRTMLASTSQTAPAPVVASPSPLPTRRSPLPWVLLAVALVTGGVIAAVTIGGSGSGPDAGTAAASASPAVESTVEPAAVEPAAIEPAAVKPAVVEPAVVEPAVEPAAVEPVVEEITLSFAVEPRAAKIEIDGTPVKGAKVKVVRDDAEHTLEITAPGRRTHTATVRFDVSQRMTIQLKKTPTQRPTRPGGKRGGAADRIDSSSPYQ